MAVNSIEDASISPTLGHAEARKLQNISRIAESIKTQQDFLTSIYEGVSGHFSDLSFVMSRTSVNSDTITLYWRLTNAIFSSIHLMEWYHVCTVQEMFCNSGTFVWLSVVLILASLTSPSLSLPSPVHNWNPVLIPVGVFITIDNSSQFVYVATSQTC